MSSRKFNLCRLCLDFECDLLDAFEDNEKSDFKLTEIIQELLSFSVSKEELVPWMVCLNCVGKLGDFYHYKKRVIKNRKLLEILLSGCGERSYKRLEADRVVYDGHLEDGACGEWSCDQDNKDFCLVLESDTEDGSACKQGQAKEVVHKTELKESDEECVQLDQPKESPSAQSESGVQLVNDTTSSKDPQITILQSKEDTPNPVLKEEPYVKKLRRSKRAKCSTGQSKVDPSAAEMRDQCGGGNGISPMGTGHDPLCKSLECENLVGKAKVAGREKRSYSRLKVKGLDTPGIMREQIMSGCKDREPKGRWLKGRGRTSSRPQVTEEELEQRRERLNSRRKQRYILLCASLTDEERNEKRDQWRQSNRKYYQSLSPEGRKMLNMRRNLNKQRYREQMSEEKKEEVRLKDRIRKRKSFLSMAERSN